MATTTGVSILFRDSEKTPDGIATFRCEENPTVGAKGASDETCTLDSDLGGARNVPSASTVSKSQE